jgi:hypothetical protein
MSKIEKAQKILLRFIFQPLTGFIGFLLLVIVILFVPWNGPSLMFFSLAAPWLLVPAILLYLPFISMVFHRFTLSESTKRNHALEHGTILMIRQQYGRRVRIGGNAEADGFRIYGVEKKEFVEHAFSQLLTELKRGSSEIIVSMRCGSNIGTAQGLSVVLLSLSTVILLLTDADPTVSLAVLSIDVFLYFLLRARLGNWVQRRFFMSVDFTDARIQSIYRIKKESLWEREPVFFVKTIIT